MSGERGGPRLPLWSPAGGPSRPAYAGRRDDGVGGLPERVEGAGQEVVARWCSAWAGDCGPQPRLRPGGPARLAARQQKHRVRAS
eukprot:5036995-Pyramimonas_sp.AAC.1